MNQFVNREEVFEIIERILELNLNFHYDQIKHRVTILDHLNNDVVVL